MLHLWTRGGSFYGLSTWCEVKMNMQYFECPSYIRRGDNVKIYMQMVDLKYSEKVFFSLKIGILLVVSFYGTVFSINS